MTVTEIKRKFKFNDIELTDIPNLSVDQIVNHYSNLYPELTNATIKNKGLQDDGTHLYEIDYKTGTLG